MTHTIKAKPAKAHSLERTFSKLAAVADCMWESSSQDHQNMMALVHLVAEMRVCAGLIQSSDRQQRVAGFDRWDDVLSNLG